MKNVVVRLLSLLVVSLPALGGCDASLNLIEVQQGCPDMPLRGPASYAPAAPEAVIDDFDDGDLLLKRIAGRTGSWVGFGTPTMGTVFGEASSRCVAHGTYSGHLTGTDLAPYGGNWNGVLIDPFSIAIPFDGTYGGFSFWVAATPHRRRRDADRPDDEGHVRRRRHLQPVRRLLPVRARPSR